MLGLHDAAVVGVLAGGGVLAGAVVGAAGGAGGGRAGRRRRRIGRGRRRPVRQRAGHAGGGAVVVGLVAHRLAGHLGRLAVFLDHLVDLVVVDLGRDAGVEVVLADDGAEQAADIVAHLVLVVLAAFVVDAAGVEPSLRSMCEDSRLPAWSTRLTRVGARLATLPATILMTAAICSGARVRPGLSATTIEAEDLSPSLATKEVDLAIDRCTRAEAIASIVMMLCASSPSRPRRKRTSCTNCDTPSGSFLSISSRPAGNCAVTPFEASSMRTRPSMASGTSTWPLSGCRRYGICSASRVAIMSVTATFSRAPNTGL